MKQLSLNSVTDSGSDDEKVESGKRETEGGQMRSKPQRRR